MDLHDPKTSIQTQPFHYSKELDTSPPAPPSTHEIIAQSLLATYSPLFPSSELVPSLRAPLALSISLLEIWWHKFNIAGNFMLRFNGPFQRKTGGIGLDTWRPFCGITSIWAFTAYHLNHTWKSPISYKTTLFLFAPIFKISAIFSWFCLWDPSLALSISFLHHFDTSWTTEMQ